MNHFFQPTNLLNTEIQIPSTEEIEVDEIEVSEEDEWYLYGI